MKTIKKSLLFHQLGTFVRVQNLSSPRSWNPVPNQYDIEYENGIVFQSYGSLIAVRMNGYLYLTASHDYSKTTSKYATEWTGRTTAERRSGDSAGTSQAGAFHNDTGR